MSYNTSRNQLKSQLSHREDLTKLISRKARIITSAHVENQKVSHFVMDLTRGLPSNHYNLLGTRTPQRHIYADAKDRRTFLSVMGLTITLLIGETMYCVRCTENKNNSVS